MGVERMLAKGESEALALRVAVFGPPALHERARPALRRLGARSVGAQARGADLILLQPSGSDLDSAERRARWLCRNAPVLAVVAARAARLKRRLLEAGVAGFVAPSAPPVELAHRLRSLAEAHRLARRTAAQRQELELLTSLAQRLARGGDMGSLFADAVAGLGEAAGLEEAALLVLSVPWRVESEAPEAVLWRRGGGVRRAGRSPLSETDLEALRRSRPLSEPRTGRVTYPLLARGEALAVLRVVGAGGRLPDGDAERAILRVTGLLAGAIENAEHLASLVGRSRSLEALVRESTREAERQKRLFQAVIDALPVSLHAIDRSFRVVVWNLVREAGPFGRPRGEVLGRDLFSVIGEDPALRAEYERVFATGEAIVTEVRSKSGDPPRLYRVEKIPMRLDRSGEVTHVITVGRDVTEQRAFEREMARADKMAAVGRLAAGIAHEINNPLATIASCAEAMRGRLETPPGEEARRELREDAGLIVEEAYRCKSILGNLLDFSRSAPDRKAPCDLARIAERTLRLLRHNPRFAEIDVRVEADPHAPEVLANESQLVQVLMALLLNAADASEPGGTVRLRVRPQPPEEVVLSVEDQGCGIPPHLRERIFEPFFTTKPPGQGTGLGLAVAYGLVQAHGGRLRLVPGRGRGARFDVILPAMTAAVETSR